LEYILGFCAANSLSSQSPNSLAATLFGLATGAGGTRVSTGFVYLVSKNFDTLFQPKCLVGDKRFLKQQDHFQPSVMVGAKVGGCSFGHRFLLSVGLRFDSFAQFFGIKTFGQNAIFWVERFGSQSIFWPPKS
jgi:hypothetical protein